MMKKVKIGTAIALATVIGVAGVFIYQSITSKKAYDYSRYYIEQSTNESKDEEASAKELSLSLLKQTNPDIVGIIEFDDRIIYEPVVQAPNNDFYVRKNIEKRYSAAGIPFISYDGNIDSKNVVIYGHSSTASNIIFTPLMNYVNEVFCKSHPTYKFIIEDEIRTYQIASVMNVDLNDLNDSLEFTQSEWRSTDDFLTFIYTAKLKSLCSTNVTINQDDQLMTLVTCDTRDGSKRMVIIAKLLSKESL